MENPPVRGMDIILNPGTLVTAHNTASRQNQQKTLLNDERQPNFEGRLHGHQAKAGGEPARLLLPDRQASDTFSMDSIRLNGGLGVIRNEMAMAPSRSPAAS